MITLKDLNDQPTNQLEKLNDKELDNVVGGFYSFYSPYQQLNSYYWPSTQAVLQSTRSFQRMSDLQNARWLANF